MQNQNSTQKLFEEFDNIVTEFLNDTERLKNDTEKLKKDTEKEREISKILFSNAEEHFREFRSI